MRCIAFISFFCILAVSPVTAVKPLMRRESDQNSEQSEEEELRTFADWAFAKDPDLEARPCLPTLVKDGIIYNGDTYTKDNVCSDDANNTIKDDHGNYIRYSRAEDSLAITIWQNVLLDCRSGEPYLRDMVEGFGTGVSCFTEDGKMKDNNEWRADKTIIGDSTATTVQRVALGGTANGTKRICEGDDATPPSGIPIINDEKDLQTRQALITQLVKRFDAHKADQTETSMLNQICLELFDVHAQGEFWTRGVFVTSMPHVCKEGDSKACKDFTSWYMAMMNRNLFASNRGGGKKGRAGRSKEDASHSKKCLKEVFGGEQWADNPTIKPGITVENPDCTVKSDLELPSAAKNSTYGKWKPRPHEHAWFSKGGLYASHMSDDGIANHFIQCSAPFVAGVSGTIPQSLSMAAGSPAKLKAGKGFREALDMKEILAIIAMLELGGFHSLTELVLPANHFLNTMKFKAPFDSGNYSDMTSTAIRCHDAEESCCTNSAKGTDKMYSHKAYDNMISNFTAEISKAWPVAPAQRLSSSSSSSSSSAATLASANSAVLSRGGPDVAHEHNHKIERQAVWANRLERQEAEK